MSQPMAFTCCSLVVSSAEGMAVQSCTERLPGSAGLLYASDEVAEEDARKGSGVAVLVLLCTTRLTWPMLVAAVVRGKTS